MRESSHHENYKVVLVTAWQQVVRYLLVVISWKEAGRAVVGGLGALFYRGLLMPRVIRGSDIRP